LILRTLKIKLENRVVGLDVMRSLAILSVVFGHYINLFINHLDPVIPLTNLSLKRFVYYIVMGFDGVDLFFVLSGFLIGHSLLNSFIKGKLNFNYLLHNFWIKRWFRTLPNYIFILLVLIILSFFIPPQSETELTMAAEPFYKYFIFIQNMVHGELLFFPESWSLSIEEWFYISFPILLTFLALVKAKIVSKKHTLLFSIIGFITIGTIIRISYANSANFEIIKNSLWNRDIRTSILMRLDAIIYGVLFAYFKIYFPEFFKKFRFVFLALGIGILCFAFKTMFLNSNFSNALYFSHGLYFSFVGLGMAFLLPWFYHLKINSLLLVRGFTFLSVISYSIYLVNYTLIQHTVEHFIVGENLSISVFKCCLCVLLTLVISTLLYKFIETPFMNLRKKIIHE
jgi:peptidoglycan/LPS O-acetylase OafA/YrhL